ncbi:MAG TPA: NapC/NirT family cytochrome c [Terriglobales bacterium]|nr:NapC/NirT family cytochrome c [Terriglobales bacterium]
MNGLTWLLIAQIIVTILLALVFLIRPSVTHGSAGKIIAFLALAVLPALCVIGGMNAQTQRSEQTEFCISCHSMQPYGRSLYVDNSSYIPAAHFQNHRVPADEACYACHADYTLFGPLKDKLRGVTRIYFQYVSTPPNPIRIPGGYSNSQCLRCHRGARSFQENAIHSAIMDALISNQLSCVSSGCHDTVHNIASLDHVKFWRPAQ